MMMMMIIGLFPGVVRVCCYCDLPSLLLFIACSLLCFENKIRSLKWHHCRLQFQTSWLIILYFIFSTSNMYYF